MEKFLEFIGNAGKVILAIGAGIGAAIGVAYLVIQNFRNRVNQQQPRLAGYGYAPNYQQQYIYGGTWGY